MPAAIDAEVRKQVIRQWLSGDTRAKIAIDKRVGEGTVSNIINDFKKGLEDSEFEDVRELAVESRKQGMTLRDLASRSRIYNFIKNLGANEDQIESLKIAVSETAELYNLPISAAAFRVINDIRNYNKLGGLKKQLSTLYMQVNTFNEFCSRQSQALTTLAKLQSYGVTEQHILSLHYFFEKYGNNINLESLAADLDKYGYW